MTSVLGVMLLVGKRVEGDALSFRGALVHMIICTGWLGIWPSTPGRTHLMCTDVQIEPYYQPFDLGAGINTYRADSRRDLYMCTDALSFRTGESEC